MNVNDMLWFKRVAERGSVHRAAAELGISQPTLSKAIRRIEASLGITLFERTARGMLLTAAGRLVHHRAIELSDWSHAVASDVGSFKAADTGLLRIGVVPALLQTLLIPIAKPLLRQGAARLTLRVQLSDALLQLLGNGEIDCAIAAMSGNPSREFNHEVLGIQHSFVVGRKAHPLLKRPFEATELSQQAWVMSPKHILLRQWVDHFLAETSGIEVHPVVEIDATPTVLAPLLEATNLLTVLTEDALRSPACQHLRALPAPAPIWNLDIALFWRRTAPFSPLMQQFRELARQQTHFSSERRGAAPAQRRT